MRSVLLALVVLLVVVAPAAATFPGANGKLAVSIRQADVLGECGDGVHFGCGAEYGNVFTFWPRRTLTRCSTEPHRECLPMGLSWDSTGSRIAYDQAFNLFPESYIYVARRDGSHRRRLVAGGSPAWSPDGRQLAFAGSDGIYRIRLADRRVRRVTQGNDREPDWSARGRIVFDRATDPDDNDTFLYSVRPDGGGLTRLTATDSSAASWSPGGRKIVYASAGRLFVVGASGGRPRRLRVRFKGSQPVWAPDGRKLALATESGVAVVRPDGHLVREIELSWETFDLAWQPRRR
jgi:predicted amidohydrolase